MQRQGTRTTRDKKLHGVVRATLRDGCPHGLICY